VSLSGITLVAAFKALAEAAGFTVLMLLFAGACLGQKQQLLFGTFGCLLVTSSFMCGRCHLLLYLQW
jgi:hypothetical protein